MTTVIRLEEIKQLMSEIDLISAMETGFIQYSLGNTQVPPVGELVFTEPKGEAHIKYGYIKNDDYYVVKIASGFYQNPSLGLSSSQGLMLLFDQKTGVPVAVLLDEGYLTDIRTAAAGALAARYFAPEKINGIGIIGTGIQARLQLSFLKKYHACRNVWVWGRNENHVAEFQQALGDEFQIHVADTPAEVALNSNLIVTTTPSTQSLIQSEDIQPGTHITAVGSDTADKQELDSQLLAKADIVIADSLSQCQSRGEIYQAMKANTISLDNVVELGHAIQNSELGRTDGQQITIADLTGVAVQDIMIAKAVYCEYLKTQ